MSKNSGSIEKGDFAELQLGLITFVGLALWGYAIISLAQFIFNKV